MTDWQPAIVWICLCRPTVLVTAMVNKILSVFLSLSLSVK